jgi:Zn-dependent oligopeptidase
MKTGSFLDWNFTGLDLAAEDRDQLSLLAGEIAGLEGDFEQQINEDTTVVGLTVAELNGTRDARVVTFTTLIMPFAVP